MAIQLKSTKKVSAPRIIVYGEPGVGKTTLASYFPNPVLIDLEDGASNIDIPTFGVEKSLKSTMKNLLSLADEEHDIKTVIIDSLSVLEKFGTSFVCEENKWQSISDGAFGSGYKKEDELWANRIIPVLDRIHNKGIAIVIIGHKDVFKYSETQADQYDKITFAARKNIRALIEQWADAVLFLGYQVKVNESKEGFQKRKVAIGEGARTLFATNTATINAKNRFGIADQTICTTPEEIFGTLNKNIEFFKNLKKN